MATRQRPSLELLRVSIAAVTTFGAHFIGYMGPLRFSRSSEWEQVHCTCVRYLKSIVSTCNGGCSMYIAMYRVSASWGNCITIACRYLETRALARPGCYSAAALRSFNRPRRPANAKISIVGMPPAWQRCGLSLGNTGIASVAIPSPSRPTLGPGSTSGAPAGVRVVCTKTLTSVPSGQNGAVVGGEVSYNLVQAAVGFFQTIITGSRTLRMASIMEKVQ